jgi:nitroimidazol reductase NimA-like FMN-containing flavoprotein (pyridoxamine 5'-phosphate oxidase superfamily)
MLRPHPEPAAFDDTPAGNGSARGTLMLEAKPQALLATFRELVVPESRPGGTAAPDLADLEAASAFLRQTVLPHLRGADDPANPEGPAEDSAFAYTLLAAEANRFAAAVAGLGGVSPTGGRPPVGWAAVRRRIDRIEAVLELYAGKQAYQEERVFPTTRAERAREQPAGTRPMELHEARAFLRSRQWGVLCTVGDEAPYAVPISYRYDGEVIYIATGPGRKLRNLQATPAVSLTVMEVRDRQRWTSVVVTGQATQLPGIVARSVAVRWLAGLVATGEAPEQLRRLRSATFFRIEPAEISGRSCD